MPEIEAPTVSRILVAWVHSVKGSIKEEMIYAYHI
jgi:hypothetical protein